MFHRVLVSVDSVAHASSATEVAGHLALRSGASVVLVHVEEPVSSLQDVVSVTQELERSVKGLHDRGVDVRHFVEYGDPRAAIVDAVASEHADLVILVPRRRTRLEAMLQPSVTARMLSDSPAALLIWPEGMPARVASSFLRLPGAAVIVPLDGSTLAEQALPFAADFAERYDCPLLLVRVVDGVPSAARDVASGSLESERVLESEESAGRYLATIRKRLGASGSVPVQSMILHGVTDRELVRLAQSYAGSLMVMSTHGRSGIARALLGSVATKVIRETAVPVLVIPPHAHRVAAPAEEPAVARSPTA